MSENQTPQVDKPVDSTETLSAPGSNDSAGVVTEGAAPEVVDSPVASTTDDAPVIVNKSRAEILGDKIQENYEIFMALLENIAEDRKQNVVFMLDILGERFCMAPANAKTEYGGCYPGGLLDHSIAVCKNLVKLAAVFYPGRWSAESLIVVSLLHDLGKIGNERLDQLVPQESKWHKDRGLLYEYNKNLVYMQYNQRTLYLLQQFKIDLTEEEYLAILLGDGQTAEENKAYSYQQPTLALLLHSADMLAVKQEKDE